MGWWLIKTPWEFTFVVDTQTHRWGSIAAGIERVAEQRPAIEEAYTTDDRARQTRARRDLVFPTAKRLDADTFDVLTDLLSVLHPFREITTMLQADKGTAGFVVPSIYKLYVNLTSTYVQHITPASSPQRPEQRQVVSADVLQCASCRRQRDPRRHGRRHEAALPVDKAPPLRRRLPPRPAHQGQ